MAKCVAGIITALVPWIAFWVLVIIVAMGLLTGPLGWWALAMSLGVAVGLLIWAINRCSG